jgi:cytochrome c biogenesis factor
MKDLVSNRRVSILAAAAVLSILWAIVVVWSGQPWTGYVWLATMALLLVSAALMFLGAARPTSLATVIQGVDDEPAARR